jgi:hypothetical protein
MAAHANVRKTLFLAPPARFAGINEKIKQMSERPGTKIEEDKTVSYPRRDGSMTIVTPEYWQSRDGIVPMQLFNILAKLTELVIVSANQDEVLGVTDFSDLLPGIEVIQLDANHDFTDRARAKLLECIKERLNG